MATLVHCAALYAPRPAGPELEFPLLDKVVHVLLFAAVAYTGTKLRLPSGWLIGVLAVNAVLSEVVQHWWLPQRSGDPFDTVADLVGVAAGAWAGLRRT